MCAGGVGSDKDAAPRFLQDAFRPFYLCGSVFAALAIPAWLGTWYLSCFPPSLPPLLWHMHEMVYGFAAAIIIGFLFTAARNWTGLRLPAGVHLGLLVGLWLTARLGMFFAYGLAVAVVDSLLLLIVATVLTAKFIRSGNYHGMLLVAVLLSLACSNIVFHAAMRGLVPVSPIAAVEFGLILVVLIELIVGGRIVPAFTASAIPGVQQFRPKMLQPAALAFASIAFVFDALRLPPLLTAATAFLAGIIVAVQLVGWNPFAARSHPILLILHASYAWIPVGLVLLGLTTLGTVPRSAAIHALAAGSMGGLIIGMMTRTALAHASRPVIAGRCEKTMYVLVHVSAAMRVTAALAPSVYFAGMAGAGLAWTVAFALYALSYGPLLLGTKPKLRSSLTSTARVAVT